MGKCFRNDVIFFRPCYGAAKSVSQIRTKVHRPKKLDSSLH